MRYLVLFVSAVWLAVAITVAYVPQAVPEWLALEELGPWMKGLAVVLLFFGAVLIYASSELRLRLYLRVIGALVIIKGIFFLVIPTSFTISIFSWYLSQPIWFIRTSAFVSIGLALVVAVIAVIALFEESVI